MNQRSQQRNKDRSGKEKSSNRDRNKNYNRRRRRPNKNKGGNKDGAQEPRPPKPVKHIPKRYGVVFYDTLNSAKEDGPNLLEKAKEVDQLNIVIRAEAPMDDPDLLQYGKLYAGEAWALIHDRRVEEGWYEVPH